MAKEIEKHIESENWPGARKLIRPESIQFERCEAVADVALPVFLYLRRLAADGEVIYGDDTRVRILSCLKENKELKEEARRGTHTSGLVIEVWGRKIAIYTNSRRHAGENLDELLKARSANNAD